MDYVLFSPEGISQPCHFTSAQQGIISCTVPFFPVPVCPSPAESTPLRLGRIHGSSALKWLFTDIRLVDDECLRVWADGASTSPQLPPPRCCVQVVGSRPVHIVRFNDHEGLSGGQLGSEEVKPGQAPVSLGLFDTIHVSEWQVPLKLAAVRKADLMAWSTASSASTAGGGGGGGVSPRLPALRASHLWRLVTASTMEAINVLHFGAASFVESPPLVEKQLLPSGHEQRQVLSDGGGAPASSASSSSPAHVDAADDGAHRPPSPVKVAGAGGATTRHTTVVHRPSSRYRTREVVRTLTYASTAQSTTPATGQPSPATAGGGGDHHNHNNASRKTVSTAVAVSSSRATSSSSGPSLSPTEAASATKPNNSRREAEPGPLLASSSRKRLRSQSAPEDASELIPVAPEHTAAANVPPPSCSVVGSLPLGSLGEFLMDLEPLVPAGPPMQPPLLPNASGGAALVKKASFRSAAGQAANDAAPIMESQVVMFDHA